jgi:hypothetical protein
MDQPNTTPPPLPDVQICLDLNDNRTLAVLRLSAGGVSIGAVLTPEQLLGFGVACLRQAAQLEPRLLEAAAIALADVRIAVPVSTTGADVGNIARLAEAPCHTPH